MQALNLHRSVGVGDMAVAQAREGQLITHALGSCLGVAIHDPRAGVGGLLHFMLPDARQQPRGQEPAPLRYGDSGLTLLLEQLFGLGATRRGCRAWLAGGASMTNAPGPFADIGRRNLLLARQMLWKNSIPVMAEDCGGSHSRTLRLDLALGMAYVKGPAGERAL